MALAPELTSLVTPFSDLVKYPWPRTAPGHR
jgi:hypothetical protein